MSTGNPFRRKPQQPTASDWYSGDATSTGRQSPPPDAERRRSNVKRVRIQTPPPLSPESTAEDEDPSIRQISFENHEGSPPPDLARVDTSFIPALEAKLEDPFGRSVDDEEESTLASEELLNNTRRNSATGSAATATPAVPMIRNPFQKTLATMESRNDSDSVQAPERPKLPAMDVDAFTRMLLTGNPVPGLPPDQSGNPNTITQSGGKAADDKIGPSSNDVVTSTAPLSAQKPKPPPPKHRHGKYVGTGRTPQTVSFEDFSPTGDPVDDLKGQTRHLPPTPLRHNTDIQSSFPLPLPSASITGVGGSSRELPNLTKDPQTYQNAPTSSSSQHPPSPPLSRRTGHAKAQEAENSNRPMDSNETNFSSATKSTRPPPPPPSRRAGGKSHPSQEPVSSIPEQLDQAAAISSRSSSISSHNRMTMPPPPPPRRRGSSKSSIDAPIKAGLLSSLPRASVDDHAPTVSSLERATKDLARGEDTTLADLDALQAEVDALRAAQRRKNG